MKPMPLSPVEKRRQELPKGDWNWPGADKVYKRLAEAAYSFTGHTHLGEDHVNIMAALGSGDEETCKYYASLAITYGWCKA